MPWRRAPAPLLRGLMSLDDPEPSRLSRKGAVDGDQVGH
jgi:hypothetical protein